MHIHFTRKPELWLLLLLLVPLISGQGRLPDLMAADLPQPALETGVHVESFEQVWATVRDRYHDPDLGGVDWEAVRDEFRPKIEQAQSATDARRIIQSMLNRLGSSHFYLVAGDSYGSVHGEGPPDSSRGATGLDLRVIDHRAVVSRVYPESAAAVAGVRPGWIIHRIEGEEIEPILQRVHEKYTGKTWQLLEMTDAVRSRLRGELGEFRDVEFEDGIGEVVLCRLELKPAPGTPVHRLGDMPPSRVWFESGWMEGDIGYIGFSLFEGPAYLMERFNKSMADFLPARGVVLDLRGNAGGLGMMSLWMSGWFISEKGVVLWTEITRDKEIRIPVTPRARTFDGPLVILVDECSASTAEDMAGGLQKTGRARIAGAVSAGASQPADIMKLANGDRFVFSVARLVLPDGNTIEGNGVIPDLPVTLSRADLLAGRDPALEAALRFIRNSALEKN
jgi:carboxyl-terminal processing protease